MEKWKYTKRIILLVVLAASSSAVWGQSPTQRRPQVQWLEFDRVKHVSTHNGRPAPNIPIYAGRNGDKILYALQVKGRQPEMLCVEVTTSYIGRFAKTDFQVKGQLMRVKATAVQRQATDMTLNVGQTPKGYRLTITQRGIRQQAEKRREEQHRRQGCAASDQRSFLRLPAGRAHDSRLRGAAAPRRVGQIDQVPAGQRTQDTAAGRRYQASRTARGRGRRESGEECGERTQERSGAASETALRGRGHGEVPQ